MRRPGDSPTVALIALLIAVYLCQRALAVALSPGESAALFALAPPVAERPWTIVTTVYAHWTLEHLLTNAIGLLLAGALVERHTTARRFHAYVLVTGAVAALAELAVAQLAGPHVPWIDASVAIMGTSGAAMALVGYVLASNTLTATLLGRVELGRRLQVVLVLAVAAAITYVTAGPSVALVAHFVGLLLGVVAGHRRLLRP